MKAVLTLFAALLVAAAAEDCPEPFVTIGSGCYFIPDTKRNWDFANRDCQNLAPEGTIGGLAHIEDCTQLADLWMHIEKNHEKVDYWIGGRDDEEEGIFRWISTGLEIPREVPFWYPGQPDGWVGENALSLSKTGYFADERSELSQRFICQLL